MKDSGVVFVGALRTAVGDFGGGLKDHSPVELAGLLVEKLVEDAGIDVGDIGHSVFGNVLHSEATDAFMARAAAMSGGVPSSVPALTVNRLCGSGLQAVITGAQQIQLGLSDVVLAGGAESMSRVPYWVPAMRFGQRMGDGKVIDAVTETLHCPFSKLHMGGTAECVAEKYGISREEQDELAVLSHNRAQAAIENDYFSTQIVPVPLKGRKQGEYFSQDEHVRFNSALPDMQKLRTVFKKDGTVTAGNSSGLNDAAAAVLMMSAERAESSGLSVLGRLLDYEVVGVEPEVMGIGPIPAISNLLERNSLSVEDIDLYEINEAFAAQALAVAKELNIPVDRLNPNGSGISIGHPIGATGAVVTVKALHELQRIKGRYAVVSLCIGGGQGIAVLISRA